MVICIPPPPPKAQQPLVGQGLLIIQVSRLHSIRHTTLIPTQRPIPDNKQHSIRDRHPCPWWDSNPLSQSARGHRPMLSTAPPLGSAIICMFKSKHDPMCIKCKDHPITGHEGWEGIRSIDLPFTSPRRYRGVSIQRQTPTALPPQKEPGIRCTEKWMDSIAGLDGSGKSFLQRD